MGDVRIKVGAAIDPSFAAVFGQVEGIAAKAHAKVARDAEKAAEAQLKAVEKAAAGYEKQFAKEEALAAKSVAAAEKAAGKKAAATEKALEKGLQAAQKKSDQIMKLEAKEADAAERAEQKKAQAAERSSERIMNAANKASANAEKQWAKQSAHNFGEKMRGYGRLGMEVAGAAGINLDVGANVGNSLKSADTAALLSRKGFQEGQEGVAGQKQDPTKILKDMQSAADATAKSVGEVGEGMVAFVNKSGDLEGARSMMGFIGKLANSTGADFNKLAQDAGVLSLKLDSAFGSDKAGKMKAMEEILRSLSAQGKLGAVDMADLAPQIPKLLAVADKFSGGKTEMIQMVGFMAQESAKQGGSGNAAQAATSIAALAASLTKPTTQKNFLKAGLKADAMYTDESHTKLRDPMTIIKAALLKTGGDIGKMQKLFGSAQAVRATAGLTTVFNNAGGGAAGIAAIDKEFKELGGAVLSAEQVEKDNAERLKETTAKAQLFQNQLERIAGSMAEKVMPAMEKLAPLMLQLAERFGKWMTFAAENPGKTIVMAIIASIGKASLGTVVANAIRNQMAGGGVGGGGAGGGGSGTLGKALGVVGAGLAGYELGTHMVEEAFKKRDASINNAEDAKAGAINATSAASAAQRRGSVTADDQAMIQAEAERLKARIANVQNDSGLTRAGDAMKLQFGGDSKEFANKYAQIDADKGSVPQMQSQLEKLQAEMALMRNGTLKVQVTNAADMGGAKAAGTDAGNI